MPLLSSLVSAACDELEWTCLVSLSMLLISTSFRECPKAITGGDQCIPARCLFVYSGKEQKNCSCKRRTEGDDEAVYVQEK